MITMIRCLRRGIKGKSEKLVIENHHICPLSNATNINQSSNELRNDKEHILNSPLNRTYISKVANRSIGDKNPEDYFKYVSEYAKYHHCIPISIMDSYKLKDDDENDIDYYKDIAEKRYEEIIRDLDLELELLK